MVQLVVAPSKLPGRLVEDSLRAPDVRNRSHRGYQGDTGMDWGYYSRWQTADGAIVAPGADARWRPVAFVVNHGSEIPAVATALLSAGRADLVAKRGFAEPGRVVRLAIGGGGEISLRQTKLVSPNGSSGIRPDTVVAGEAIGASRCSGPPGHRCAPAVGVIGRPAAERGHLDDVGPPP